MLKIAFLYNIFEILYFYCFIYRGKTAYDLNDKVQIALAACLMFFAYISVLVRLRSEQIKNFITTTLLIHSFQYILYLKIDVPVATFTQLFSPIVSYFFIYSSVLIILYGNRKVGREVFQVMFLVEILTCLVCFINEHYYAVMSFFCIMFVNFIPMLICLIYKKEVRTMLTEQKRNLYFLASWNVISYFLIYLTPLSNTSYSGIMMCSSTFVVLLVLHIKIIVQQSKTIILELKSYYLNILANVLIVIAIIYICAGKILDFDFGQGFISLQIMQCVLFYCVLMICKIMDDKKYEFSGQELKRILFKRNMMVKELLNDMDQTIGFSEYLHDEVLQSVIAIKNYNKYGEREDFRMQIDQASQELISNIRNKIDYYEPVEDNGGSTYCNYVDLIYKIKHMHHSEKEINLNMREDIVFLSPYSKILYRIVEELITNAIKYGTSDWIDVSIEVADDQIYLCCKNEMEENAMGSGYGIRSVRRQVEILNGLFNIDTGKYFLVNIELPIDKELCYADFTN